MYFIYIHIYNQKKKKNFNKHFVISCSCTMANKQV